MFLAHSFRLRDPWQCESAKDGLVRWSRVFHRPTGMEPTDTLWLVVSGLPPDAQTWLNDSLLPPLADRPGQFEVTPLLTDANRILIECRGKPGDKFPFDARLGIVGQE